MLQQFFRPARIHFSTAAISFFPLALATEALAAQQMKPSCGDVQRRVHGHGPATLRKIWQELGVTPALYMLDEWQNPTNEFAEKAILQVHRESGPIHGTRSSYVLLVISGTPYGPHQYLFFVR